MIGKESFTKQKNERFLKSDPNRHFCLKNCEKLRELKIDCYSFSDYSTCAIENLPSLEGIEMGDLIKWSYIFYESSLELRSAIDGMK